jgi:sec-independent protein translocase protein TatA
MGPLGWQETVFIFVLALLLFGPKKLPELGKTLGKAITEFRRASNELKATFNRELSGLERENESIREVTSSYIADAYNYDHHGEYNTDSPYDGGYGAPPNDSTATETSTVSASATQGAESHSGEAPEGTVATTAALAAPGQAATEPPNGTPSAESKAG